MKLQSAVLGDGNGFGMISGACTPTSSQPIGHRRQLQRNGGHGRRRGRVVLPQRDGLRGRRGRNLERDVVVSGSEQQQPGHRSGGARSLRLQERDALGLSQRERNLDRQRQRDVHGRYDHDGQRPAWTAGRVFESFGDQDRVRRYLRTARRAGLRQRHLHTGRGRRVYVHGHGPADGRDRLADRGSAAKRQLHDVEQRAHRRRHHEVLVLRRGQQHDLDPAELEPDHVGHDRVREERNERRRRNDRIRRHDRGSRHDRDSRHHGDGRHRRVRPARRVARAAGAARRDRRRRGRGGTGGAGGTAGTAGAAGRPARPARPGRAARAASTDPAISMQPPARRARRRTAWFGRSRRRTPARFTRSGAGARR